jgi:hypothetical protein
MVTEGTENFKALSKCLEQRHKHGIPLVSVNLHSSYLDAEEVLLLDQYVERILCIIVSTSNALLRRRLCGTQSNPLPLWNVE